MLIFINKFTKDAEYKNQPMKAVVFLYTNNELLEKEIKKATPLITATQTIKYLGINLEETEINGDIIHSWIRRINNVRISILPKVI